MARKPDVPCSRCGRLMWGGSSSLPAGQRTCHPCRRIERVPYGVRSATPEPPSTTCPACNEEFAPRRSRNGWTVSCSKRCAAHLRNPPRSELDRRRTRYERELSTAGLTRHQRDALRAKWVAQGRRCTYCADGAPTTVDHVVPLIRGGTNWEGNLAPACRSCNSSKGTQLLVEWRSVRATRLRLMRGGLRRQAA